MVGQQRIAKVFALVVVLGILATGCKKDDATTNPVVPGITTLSFTTPNQSLTVPSTGGAVKAKLTGGTLPYSITGEPNPNVATASLGTDTITVTPVGAGTTSITITDSNPENIDNPPRVVTISLTVSGGGGSLGSGTVTAASTAGNLNLTGTGVWPAGAGPSVIGVYDTLTYQFVILGYQQVSGSHYNYVLLGMLTPGGPAVGTYAIGQSGYFLVGYNADTSDADTIAYTGTSGSVVVSSVSGTNAQGTYSGQAVNGSGQPIQMSGTFNVTFTRGRSPIQVGGGGLARQEAFGEGVRKQKERLRQ